MNPLKSFFAVSVSMCIGAVGAQAAVFNVNQDGSGDFTTVAEAVAAAFANDEADEIVIAPGTYVVNGFIGEELSFVGDDSIVLRGSDPADRPVIPVEPNFTFGTDTLDGVYIRMGGSLTFQDLVFIPAEGFTLEAGVDDLFAVENAGVEGAPSSLELIFRNVLITHSSLDNVPTPMFEDPRFEANTIRGDAINIFTNPDPETSPNPPDDVTLLIEDVIINAHGSEANSSGIILDGPGIDATITGDTKILYPRWRGIYSFDSRSLTVSGTAENPIIVWGANETLARAGAGVNNWSHLWCIGMQEGDGDLAINTGWALRVDPANGASLNMDHCIFAFTNNDGGFMNFPSDIAIDHTISDSTFYNVPELMRFGFVGQPGPGENVTLTVSDTIIDNADWTAPNDGIYFPPEPTVIDFGDGDNTLAQVTLSNIAYRTETLISSRSGSRTAEEEGNIIAVDDFQFLSTEFDINDYSDFLVVSNCELLGSAGSGGAPLGGARESDCPVSGINDWSIH